MITRFQNDIDSQDDSPESSSVAGAGVHPWSGMAAAGVLLLQSREWLQDHGTYRKQGMLGANENSKTSRPGIEPGSPA